MTIYFLPSPYLKKAVEFHKVMALSTKNPIFYTIWNAFSDLIFKYYGHLLEDVDKEILNRLYLVPERKVRSGTILDFGPPWRDLMGSKPRTINFLIEEPFVAVPTNQVWARD